MSEKLCLQWNDFKENASNAFGNLREDSDFADVTLACEDGNQVEAHKVILAASSPFFQNLLRRNKHPHPLIYMRGVKSEDLVAIVDFLYCEEANVFQENLDSFLAIAEELELKGLTGQGSASGNNVEKEILPKPLAETGSSKFTAFDQTKQDDQTLLDEYDKANKSVALTNLFSGELQELDEKVKAMVEKSHNVSADGKKTLYVCKACGKEGEDQTNMKRHVEAIHLEGVSIPCNLCGKTSRTRHAMNRHKAKFHVGC